MASVLSRIPQPHRSAGTVLLLALALAACGDGGENTTDPSIEEFLGDTLPEGAGGTLVAARDGKPIHCRGFGMADREAGVPATCDTAYDVMSMTKQFTAAAILKLEMMGKLRLGDPLHRYLEAVPADKRGITVHHLLTHTGGLVEAVGGDYHRQTRASLLAAAFDSKLRSPPGTEYLYSNLGYSVLAAVIEKVSGMGYEEFLAKHLFAPAGMTQTGYVGPEWKADQVAVEYDSRGESQGRPFDHPWAGDGPYWNLRGNGGLLSTGRDVLRWHLALEGDEILDRQAKRKLFRPHVLEEPGGKSHYGYGWVVLGTEHGKVAWHNGGNGWSYGELTRLLDEGAMVFWITNRYEDRAGGWNLERIGPKLTQGVVDRVLAG